MTVQAVLAPVFVLVALTFLLMFWLGYQRIGALRRREARTSEIALGQPNWPPRALQASNAFNNLFQLPLLFYVLVVLALMMHKADFIFVLLSWLFVLSRIIHACIFVTTNTVNHRFAVYVVGLIALIIMWAKFAIDILFYV
jgi:hypothetical protein